MIDDPTGSRTSGIFPSDTGHDKKNDNCSNDTYEQHQFKTGDGVIIAGYYYTFLMILFYRRL